jgi:dihydrofolate reductase
MAELIVTEFVSIDGVVEAPGGEPGYPHSGWVFDYMGKEQEEYKLQEVLDAGSHLLGRVTYESFAGAWPERSGPFAEKMNAMPKYVASTTLDQLEWENSTLLEGDVAAAVRELKQADGGPILVAGSRTLVQTLFEHDLIDELHLMVFPLILGSGKRLFRESTDKIPLQLADTATFASGVQVNSYRRG